MDDVDIIEGLTNVRGDLKKWLDMLEQAKQKKIAEEREKKLNKILKKKWLW